MESNAEERLRSVLVDIGTRLDKIAGPFKVGATKAVVRCPWHTEKTGSFVLQFHDGETEPPSQCLSCGIHADVLFTADDGADAYAIVRRRAENDDEIASIVSLGV